MKVARGQYDYSEGGILSTLPQHHSYRNREEILDTYEIVEIDSLGNLALALSRYSIGGDVFRESMYLIRQDGRWYPHPRYLISYPEREDLPDELKAQYEELIEKETNWLENSAKVVELEEVLRGNN